jgi:hypothetical protein
MFMNGYFIVFPEGGVQGIPGSLPLNSIAGINGRRLRLPLPASRTIAFRVYRIKVDETGGGSGALRCLELPGAGELRPLARP